MYIPSLPLVLRSGIGIAASSNKFETPERASPKSRKFLPRILNWTTNPPRTCFIYILEKTRFIARSDWPATCLSLTEILHAAGFLTIITGGCLQGIYSVLLTGYKISFCFADISDTFWLIYFIQSVINSFSSFLFYFICFILYFYFLSRPKYTIWTT